MAYLNSGPLSPGGSYQLGEYTISLTATPDPGEGTTGINVRCDKGGERARVSDEVTGPVESWCVEANTDTADVYVTYKNIPPVGNMDMPIPSASTGSATNGIITHTYEAPWMTLAIIGGTFYKIFASDKAGDKVIGHHPEEGGGEGRDHIENLSSTYTYAGKTVYYRVETNAWSPQATDCSPRATGSSPNVKGIAWYIVYGGGSGENEILVARFQIDLHDAGGTGPDSEWEDPGDYDEERDPEDPTTTLHLTITGATSGTHSGVPAAKPQQEVYGSGGDGGNGGGGGAGASTIIVNQFATDRADHKEIVATAKAPGVGSGGGAGAKGGDGCILIFW